MSEHRETFDAVVIGSGPNGLSAAVALAQAGASVLVLEAAEQIGGGTRTAELTLPGFQHDVCSAVHTTGILSPFFRSLPLEDHGLRWVSPPASVAHPLDDQPAVIMWRSLEETASGLGADASSYRDLIAPFLENAHGFFGDALGPLGVPRHPVPFRPVRAPCDVAGDRLCELAISAVAGQSAVRRLRGPQHPAARQDVHGGPRAHLLDRRPRRALADRVGRLAGDPARAWQSLDGSSAARSEPACT